MAQSTAKDVVAEESGATDSASNGTKRPVDTAEDIPKPKNPSKLEVLWTKIGLDAGTVIAMAKGAAPPVIAIAMYQSTPVANTFGTLGYLVSIISIISLAMMPRAKFLQILALNLVAVCIGAAVSLLAIYCSTQARKHTTPPGANPNGYNSSASAVSAIWLIFNIWFSNTIRASRPQLAFPVVQYSILASIAMTFAPNFVTMAQGISLIKRLLEAFLAGMGIATGVSLLIIPISSRTVVFAEAAEYLKGLRGALKAQSAYMESLEDPENLAEPLFDVAAEEEEKKGRTSKKSNVKEDPRAVRLAKTIGSLTALHGKMHGDLEFAKREMAWGHLDADDIENIFQLLRGVLLPVLGMTTLSDIFGRIAGLKGIRWEGHESASDEMKEKERKEWAEIMRTLHIPFNVTIEVLDEAIKHVMIRLELGAKPKKTRSKSETNGAGLARDTDVEGNGDRVAPGEDGFAAYYERKTNEFYQMREIPLRKWCEQRGIDFSTNLFGRKSPPQPPDSEDAERSELDEEGRNRRQLYMILYMEYLLYSTGKAVKELVRFADLKVEDGTMKKSRFINPGVKRLKKWLKGLSKGEDSTADQLNLDNFTAGTETIYLGDSLKSRRDPEHLPPTNFRERIGDGIRTIPRFLGSSESAFGLRVAAATMTVAIVAFLKDSYVFFNEQRLVWAMIIIAISMSTTTGSSIFGFVGRVLGTLIAMIAAFINWYMVDGKTAGVIMFLFVFTFIEFYFLIKFPRLAIVVILSVVTQVLIIGYELQVRKVGLKVSTASGQPFYPIYELGPYRLLTVAGGCVVAFFWTIFPYPITARRQLRMDLGASLFLLANLYSCVHTTVRMRVNGTEGDMDLKTSPGRRLEKMRNKILIKQLMLLNGLKQHSEFTLWEPSLGGRFPKTQYDEIINQVQNITNYLTLIGYASQSFRSAHNNPETRTWLHDFSSLLCSVNITSHEITSLLSLLSASVTNAQPLPPYLKVPNGPMTLATRLDKLDQDILGMSHMSEPGYAAFASIQVAKVVINDDLEKLVRNVKALVGEVDFSFHFASTPDSSGSSQSSQSGKDGGGKGKRD